VFALMSMALAVFVATDQHFLYFQS